MDLWVSGEKSKFEVEYLDKHCAAFERMYYFPVTYKRKSDETVVFTLGDANIAFAVTDCILCSASFAKMLFWTAMSEWSRAIICKAKRKQKRGICIRRDRYGKFTFSDGLKSLTFSNIDDLGGYLFETSDNNDIGREMSEWLHEEFDIFLKEKGPFGAEYPLQVVHEAWIRACKNGCRAVIFKTFVEENYELVK